jgi:hypothetical protein
MAVLSQQLTRDIAQAFHMGLRKDAVSPAEAKALAVFLFGLAHLSEGQAQASADGQSPAAQAPQPGAADPASVPALPTDEVMLAQLRAFLQRTNEEKGYAVKSKLLDSAEHGANKPL